MNDLNMNTRTLIVSFVIAIMFLIPLRFVEVGQNLNNYNQSINSQVLGETISNQEVVLPNAQVEKEAVFEAPYNEIDNKKIVTPAVVKKQAIVAEVTTVPTDCLTSSDAKTIVGQLANKIKVGQLTKAEMDEVTRQIAEIRAKTCK